MVQYKYDAWGNHTVSGTKATTIGALNPFRYRSYFYDIETGLYYLQTRYYDPEVGRFLNMDSVSYADPEATNGLNLYVYCGNNPVMNVDPTGTSFIVSLLIAFAIGATLGGITGGTSAAANGQNFWGGFLSGALVGGVLGAATILGGATALAIGGKTVAGFVTASTLAGKGMLLATSVGITALTSFGAGIGSYAIEKSLNNEQFHWNEALLDGTNTMLKGFGSFVTGMALASGGAYNFLIEGAAKRTISKMVIGGIINGTVGTVIKMTNIGWNYGL